MPVLGGQFLIKHFKYKRNRRSCLGTTRKWLGQLLTSNTNSVLKKQSFFNHYSSSIEVGIKINTALRANCFCQKHSSDNRLLKNMCEILFKYQIPKCDSKQWFCHHQTALSKYNDNKFFPLAFWPPQCLLYEQITLAGGGEYRRQPNNK